MPCREFSSRLTEQGRLLCQGMSIEVGRGDGEIPKIGAQFRVLLTMLVEGRLHGGGLERRS
jgi:hypothetical protein